MGRAQIPGLGIAGGATTINRYLAVGLIDELRLHIAPLMLGAGTRLFEGVPPLKLEQVRSRAATSDLRDLPRPVLSWRAVLRDYRGLQHHVVVPHAALPSRPAVGMTGRRIAVDASWSRPGGEHGETMDRGGEALCTTGCSRADPRPLE
jgi:hypothetical protein